MITKTVLGGIVIGGCISASTVAAQSLPGESPVLGPNRVAQEDIENGFLTLQEIRAEGLKIFASPFNALDGYGDGPMNPKDTVLPGGRPTLQNNGTFLRINGLDAQTCMECHSVGSNTTAPFTFAVGGAGGSNNNAIFQPTEIDVTDRADNGYAFFNGRFINPPFLFGSGGVELAAKEMTEELQSLKQQALQQPGTWIRLRAKGVEFGRVRFDEETQEFDTSRVRGIDGDLVVRPFGRKGEFASVRAFDVEALPFHMGMQPVEMVGEGVDDDRDGVINEITVGELSALHIFNTNLEKPTREIPRNASDLADLRAGFAAFVSMGCAECHRPFLDTFRSELTYSFPELEEEPFANAFMSVDLADSPAGFDRNDQGGIRVPLFSDLKRHDMGPELAESFGSELDPLFVTARLWGIADTAPYLHDGRALTLSEAILWHGGEAGSARDEFENASDRTRVQLLGFLRSLRTPVDPASDLLE